MAQYYKGKGMSNKDQKDLENLIRNLEGFSREVHKIAETKLSKVANKLRKGEASC